jgi:hypothetical protein
MDGKYVTAITGKEQLSAFSLKSPAPLATESDFPARFTEIVSLSKLLKINN